MRFTDIFKMCLRNLTKRKMRTFLTVSGIVIGALVIVIMISLGIGMTSMLDAMMSKNADLSKITINYSKPSGDIRFASTEVDGGGLKTPPVLNDEEIAKIRKMPHVRAVMPMVGVGLDVGSDVALYSPENKFTVSGGQIYAVDMNEMENFGYKLTAGHFKTKNDAENSIILGGRINANIIYYEDNEYKSSKDYSDGSDIPNDPLFDPMKTELHLQPVPIKTESSGPGYVAYTQDFTEVGIESSPFYEYDMPMKVIGVMKGNWANEGTMNGVFMDIKMCNKLIENYADAHSEDPNYIPNKIDPQKDGYNTVFVRADNMDNVPVVEKQLKELGYHTYSQNEMREEMHKQLMIIQLILGAFAGISLFVAALNITNTMIMAIVERTKEIGIMKVLGCDISKIRLLFLGEAASIGLLGGIIGVILSFGVSFVLNYFLAPAVAAQMGGNAADLADLSISVIPLWLIFGTIGFSTVIGMIAGIYPSGRSVKISALAAISHD